MSRDANGTYVLPVGNPVISGTVIESNWANATMDDIATSLSNSLDRDGRGGMRAPFKLTDGIVTAPSFSFVNEPNTGIYRADDGDFRISVLGVDAFRITDGSFLSITENSLIEFAGGGTYSFDGTGLTLVNGEFYIGDVINNVRILNSGAGGATAREISYDNTGTPLPAGNVQDAINQLVVGSSFVFGSVRLSGGGALTAGVLNIITDSNTYTLPLAADTFLGTVIRISLPRTFSEATPFLEAVGGDLITWERGTDTLIEFVAPTVVLLTSNGVDTWEL